MIFNEDEERDRQTLSKAQYADKLAKLLQEARKYMKITGEGCHGEKCRLPTCHSCNGEDEAEAEAEKATLLYELIVDTLTAYKKAHHAEAL